MCGGDWREEMGSDKHANRDGPLYDLPDYRYPDGSEGVPRSEIFVVNYGRND